MDNRAQSIGIARYFLALLAGSFMIWMVSKVGDNLLPKAKSDLSPARQGGTTMLSQGIELLPIIILLIALLSVIILAVYQREVIR